VTLQPKPRVILIDSYEATREALAARLRAQGYVVETADDSATGADMALSAPPAAVIADLWMPSISGVQICRLLRSEPATADVPVILRGETDDPKSRFWSERAGAAAYVVKGRMGDLVRSLARAIAAAPEGDGFFQQLSGGRQDIRDRIAQHLDAALFESVISSEVRALGSAGTFNRLFDLLSQLVSQLTSYRWLALSTAAPEHFGLHQHARSEPGAEAQARALLGVGSTVEAFLVNDEDALPSGQSTKELCAEIGFAGAQIATLGLSVPLPAKDDVERLLGLIARELGGPLRMTALIEETQRQASTDSLTGLLNRRAVIRALEVELARSERHAYPLSVLLLDIDHFKSVNDRRGHAAGDQVLSRIGSLLAASMRKSDLGARWGGEEFVVVLMSTDLAGGRIVAERIRADVEALEILDMDAQPIRVTASVGLATLRDTDTLHALVDRADRAMYSAKAAGRNRVMLEEGAPVPSDAPSPATTLVPSGRAQA
jgi:two-component system cell cycle response regulator